jgi:hypothetical protein
VISFTLAGLRAPRDPSHGGFLAVMTARLRFGPRHGLSRLVRALQGRLGRTSPLRRDDAKVRSRCSFLPEHAPAKVRNPPIAADFRMIQDELPHYSLREFCETGLEPLAKRLEALSIVEVSDVPKMPQIERNVRIRLRD